MGAYFGPNYQFKVRLGYTARPHLKGKKWPSKANGPLFMINMLTILIYFDFMVL